MFLHDFYVEFDKNNCRRRVIFGLIFFAIFAYAVFVVATCSNQPTQEDIEQTIKNSSNLSDLHLFCHNMQKPPNFKYKFKTLGGNSMKLSIGYWYQSILSFSEVRDFYTSYLEKEGWTLEEVWNEERSAIPKFLRYRKEKRTIAIEKVFASDANYAFECGVDR